MSKDSIRYSFNLDGSFFAITKKFLEKFALRVVQFITDCFALPFTFLTDVINMTFKYIEDVRGSNIFPKRFTNLKG